MREEKNNQVIFIESLDSIMYHISSIFSKNLSLCGKRIISNLFFTGMWEYYSMEKNKGSKG